MANTSPLTMSQVLTLRLRMPISDDLHPRSLVTKLIGYEKIINVPNSMSVVSELVPLAVGMSRAKYVGIYNFTNPGVISHNGVLDLYIAHVDPSYSYTNFSIAEQSKVLVAARSNNALDTTKLEAAASDLKLTLSPIHIAVENAMKCMAGNI